MRVGVEVERRAVEHEPGDIRADHLPPARRTGAGGEGVERVAISAAEGIGRMRIRGEAGRGAHQIAPPQPPPARRVERGEAAVIGADVGDPGDTAQPFIMAVLMRHGQRQARRNRCARTCRLARGNRRGGRGRALGARRAGADEDAEQQRERRHLCARDGDVGAHVRSSRSFKLLPWYDARASDF